MFLATNNESIGSLKSPSAMTNRTRISIALILPFVSSELGNKTTISYLSVQQSKLSPLGAVDDLMHCCPLPSASGNSASDHPQHLVGDSFDCCTERYEIFV